MIPGVKDEFWVKLVNGEVKHDFKLFALRMYVSQAIEKYQQDKLTKERAIEEIYNICSRFPNVASAEFTTSVTKAKRGKMRDVSEVAEMIKDGKKLMVAGSSELLESLPTGYWIGTTMPYFMTSEKGMYETEKIFTEDFSEYVADFSIKTYQKHEISDILEDRYTSGFSYLLMPGLSEIASAYGMEVLNKTDLFKAPIVGFLGGVKFEEAAEKRPKIFDGTVGESYEDRAVVFHTNIHDKYFASTEIVNIFSADTDSPEIIFENDGYVVENCLIDGKETNFYEYLTTNKSDIRFPLVTNYGGAFINSSFFQLQEETKSVVMAAPLVAGRTYAFATNLSDYVAEFERNLPDDRSENIVASANCLYNYFYGELEGKQINVSGPMAYGEIAYRLLNQTMVYLRIEEV